MWASTYVNFRSIELDTDQEGRWARDDESVASHKAAACHALGLTWMLIHAASCTATFYVIMESISGNSSITPQRYQLIAYIHVSWYNLFSLLLRSSRHADELSHACEAAMMRF